MTWKLIYNIFFLKVAVAGLSKLKKGQQPETCTYRGRGYDKSRTYVMKYVKNLDNQTRPRCYSYKNINIVVMVENDPDKKMQIWKQQRILAALPPNQPFIHSPAQYWWDILSNEAEPAPNLPTNPNSDLDEILPNGSQQLVDDPSLPTHLNSDLDETLPYGNQQLVDAPSLPNNPNSDLDNTLPYGRQQFVDASEPLTSSCPNSTNLASSEPSNPDDDLALPIAARRTWRPRKPRDIRDLWSNRLPSSHSEMEDILDLQHEDLDYEEDIEEVGSPPAKRGRIGCPAEGCDFEPGRINWAYSNIGLMSMGGIFCCCIAPYGGATIPFPHDRESATASHLLAWSHHCPVICSEYATCCSGTIEKQRVWGSRGRASPLSAQSFARRSLGPHTQEGDSGWCGRGDEGSCEPLPSRPSSISCSRCAPRVNPRNPGAGPYGSSNQRGVMSQLRCPDPCCAFPVDPSHGGATSQEDCDGIAEASDHEPTSPFTSHRSS